jgi:adenylate cyclase
VDAEFDDIGEQNLKNIARPLRVYRYRALPAAATKSPATALPLPDKPSLAVLPFQNLSGDPEQEYFADGMVEEIATAISRLPWLTRWPASPRRRCATICAGAAGTGRTP